MPDPGTRKQLEDLAHHLELLRSQKNTKPMDLSQLQTAIMDLYVITAEVARMAAKG